MSSNSKEDISKNVNNTSIDILLESSMKEFLEKMLNYLEKFITSDEEIEEVERKLYDYANLSELMEIIKNIFSDIKSKVDRTLKKKDLNRTDDNNNDGICPEDYAKLERILQKHEGEIRNHISIEQQLRLCAESLQSKVEETEKNKLTICESTNNLINALKKEKAELVIKNKKLIDENEKFKKLILIKEQKEKELTVKLENYPFLQQKLKALESILKRKKIPAKLPSFEKMDESGAFLPKPSDSKKNDCDGNSPLEKSAESRKTSRERRKKQTSFHQSSANPGINNFQDFLKMRIAMGKDLSEKKEGTKRTADDLKKALNQLPLFKLPKHPIVDSKEKLNKEIDFKSKDNSKKNNFESEREFKHLNKTVSSSSKPSNEINNNPLVSASNFNINVTNLTNSLIVTQNNNQGKEITNPLDIPTKIKVSHHKKSKSQGQKNGLYSQTNTSNGSNPFAKKMTPATGYKTSLEFYDGQLRKKK